MNKILKRSIFLSLMLMLILIGNIVVKADGNWINTSISISDNSTIKRKIRTYNYSNYQIDITPTKLEAGMLLSGKVRVILEMRRPTYTLGIETGHQTKYAHYVEFDEKKGIGTTQTKKAGCGKGKLYFYFSTLGKNGAGWGSMDADAVIKNYQ